MYKIAKLNDNDRRTLFRNTAQKIGLHEAIVEKDFWVCLTLDYLFHKCKWKDAFTFKGGTSLSKCYNLIQRFSEDIDLILDWRILGYSLNEPWEDRSKTKQDTFNKEADHKAEVFLRDEFMPEIQKDMSEIIGSEAKFYIDPQNAQVVCFEYPHIFKTASILQIIRLEIGALAAWTPATTREVVPYVATHYPQIFEKSTTNILTAAAERTFWEKVTILHHEANRPEDSAMPSRYSRHYYDLYCIAHSENKIAAFNNLELLKKVVDFKMKFYPRGWAHYENAKPGTIKLMPPEFRLAALEKDYSDMSEMMFGTYPTFSELMSYIKELECDINSIVEE